MKNEKIIYVSCIILGLIFGWVLWGNKSTYHKNMHTMPDGRMMKDSHMDMSSMMQDMMHGLEGKKGDDFDKAFISEMIIHHEGAVAMANAVLLNSNKPELVKLANDIIVAQTKEIEMMKEWQNTWFDQ